MKITVHFAAAAALALSGCSASGTGDETGEPDEAGSATEAVDPAAAASAQGAMPGGEQGFADTVAASDMFEIESGKLAQANGSSPEVKDFGAMLVTDHTRSTADLKAAAGQSEGVTVAPKLTAKQQTDLDALKKAGDAFDRTFKDQQIAAHSAALALLEAQAANGEGALKAFAAKAAPVVEGHLEKARTLP